MSAALHLAGPNNRDALLKLICASQDEIGSPQTPDELAQALDPLLQGAPHGCAYLIGPVRAPLGFVLLSFGWSVPLGGLTATIETLFVRPSIRKRGIATEALISLPKALAQAGLVALFANLRHDTPDAQRLFTRLGFSATEENQLQVNLLR
jgi:ribosomal protein S18 acetylase RimI-like enzyme